MTSKPPAAARAYLGAQAVAGALWWIAVFSCAGVRRWTLGGIDPALLAVADLVLFVGASAVAAMTGSRWAAIVAAVWTTAVTVALTVYGLVERAAGWGVVAMVLATIGTLAAASTMWFGRLPTGRFFSGPFAFREARPSTPRRHLLRSLGQVAVFWTVFFALVPAVLVTIERRLRLDWAFLHERWAAIVGVVVFVLASSAALWSCVTMALQGDGTPLPAETARRLVVRGPYRFVRNPMAVTGALQVVAVGLVAGSWMVIAVAVAGAVAWHVVIRPVEEADLAARFGDDYARYCAAVRCWIPTLRLQPSR